MHFKIATPGQGRRQLPPADDTKGAPKALMLDKQGSNSLSDESESPSPIDVEVNKMEVVPGLIYWDLLGPEHKC